MKRISLTQRKFAIVDDENYEYLSQWKWCFAGGYATRKIWDKVKKKTNKTIWMHREILNTPEGMFTDHINGNRIDNRKENLRICTKAENLRNRGKQVNNTSGLKGVHLYKKTGRWMAFIFKNRKKIHLGYFSSKNEAGKAYNKAARKYHEEFSMLNQI